MIYIFCIWAFPLVFFWVWYFLSFYDINFGILFLSRRMHDLVFHIYGEILHVDPQIIPGLVAKACVVDTLLILAIWAFRRRKKIAAWYRARYAPPALPSE